MSLFTSSPLKKKSKFTTFAEFIADCHAAAERVYERYEMVDAKKKVKLDAQVSICAGGRHAIFASNVGLIRKPL